MTFMLTDMTLFLSLRAHFSRRFVTRSSETGERKDRDPKSPEATLKRVGEDFSDRGRSDRPSQPTAVELPTEIGSKAQSARKEDAVWCIITAPPRRAVFSDGGRRDSF